MNPISRLLCSRFVLTASALTLTFGLAGCGVRCCVEDKDNPSTVAFDGDKDKDAPKPAADAKPSSSMYGGTIHRNMVNTIDKNIPESWTFDDDDKTKWKNIKWAIDLGTDSYGGPVIAGGKIFVGTNNGKPRDPKIEGDKGVLMCFREGDGKFLWQAVFDKLDNPNDYDNPQTGIVSAPAVEGDRLYFVSNRCEVVCADVEGDQKTGQAKILWTLDMRKELKVSPRAASACSPLVVGDLVFVVTSNGVEISEQGKIKNPDAPSFIAVNKKTGKLVWKDSSPGNNILEGQWSNPVAAEIKGVTQVIFPGGDGWVYSFEATTGKLLWKFDCNPKSAVFKPTGRISRGYPLATPVVYEDKLFVSIGLDPSDGPGLGHLWCLDLTKEPKNKDKDLSPVNDNFDPKAEVNKDSGLVWHHGGIIMPKPAKGRDFIFGRTLSTVAIHEGLIYAPDLDGYMQCLDAKTGMKLWEHDMKAEVWASPYYVDGKVLIGTKGGDVFLFKHGKEKKVLPTITMAGEIQGPVLVANGVLYVNLNSQLVAIAPDKK